MLADLAAGDRPSAAAAAESLAVSSQGARAVNTK